MVKVIGAGFPRTGTSSFQLAMDELGFGPCYHNTTLWEKPEQVDIWKAVQDGEPVDWHAVFAGYNSTIDWPAAIYYEQIMQAFPEAKVVLTVRDPESWYESLSNTILWAIKQPPANPALEKYGRVMGVFWQRIFEGKVFDRDSAIAVFKRENEKVKERVPAERLLVFDVKEGWEPLCRFLGVPVPEGRPFPRVHDTEAFRQRVVGWHADAAAAPAERR